MRKSTRESRRPDFLTYQGNPQAGRGRVEENLEISELEEKEVDAIEEEHNDIDFFEKLETQKKKSKKRPKATNNESITLVQESDVLEDEKKSIFGLLQTHNMKNVASICDRWVEKLKTRRIEAFTELINFVLMAGGFQDKTIPEDTDLEALNTEEMEHMLSPAIESATKMFPLLEKGKVKHSGSFRSKYREFWEALAVKFTELKPTNSNKKSLKTLSNNYFDDFKLLIDHLASISSLPSVNIRYAVTDAAMSLANGLIPVANQLKDATLTAERQIHSETGSARNPKSQAFAEQKEEYSKELNQWSEVIGTIFNAFYISRSKDFSEDIRLICVEQLASFIRFDSTKLIKNEYLKYLGWACYDYSHSIRLAAVKSIKKLIEDDPLKEPMKNFVLHFMDRFIEIASSDIDTSVSLEMISTMRVMQRQGYLDSVSEEKLDHVDMIIFDPDATADMRKEALLFMMDHTEGFDVQIDEEKEQTTAKRKNNRKGNTSSSENNREKERKRNIAFQLETLTEFVEHNLGEKTEWSYLLAEACLTTEKASIFYDWDTSIALLMKDNDDELIAKPLRTVQITILLQMVVTAAKKVNRDKKDLEDGGKASKEKELINHRWETLNHALGNKLSLLLVRLKDDEKNLSALAELLSCCEINMTLKSSQSLIKGIQEIFVTFSNESLLRNIIAALKRWNVNSAFEMIFNSVAESFRAHIQGYQQFLQEREDADKEQTQKKKRSSRSSKGANNQSNERDYFHDLSGNAMRLRVLLESIDCRKYFLSSDIDVAESIKIACDQIVARFTSNYEESGDALALLSKSDSETIHQYSTDLLFGLFALMLWKYREIIDFGKEVSFNPVVDSDAAGSEYSLKDVFDEKKIEALMNKSQDLLSVRGALVTIASSYMNLLKVHFGTELEHSEDEIDTQQPYRSVIETFAIAGFRVISLLRSYFPLKQNKFLAIDQLVYQPTAEVLGLLKFVFDSVSNRINKQLEQLADEPSPQLNPKSEANGSIETAKLSRILIDHLLVPLSGSFIFDTQNFNRRQTAAVLLFILHRNAAVQDAVKLIAKRLRENDLVAYLEAQFVALKSCFTEDIAAFLVQRQEVENAEEEVDFDFSENEQFVQLGYDRLIAYSRKFASLLGVGKLKDMMLQAVEAFLKLAIDFALQDSLHVGFCEAISPFLRFLTANRKSEFHNFVMNELQSNEKYADVFAEFLTQKAAPNSEFTRFISFLDQLSGAQQSAIFAKSKHGKPKRKANLPIREEDGSESEESKGFEINNEDEVLFPSREVKQKRIRAVKGEKASKLANGDKLPTSNKRRSTRNVGKKIVSYEEDIDDDEEENYDAKVLDAPPSSSAMIEATKARRKNSKTNAQTLSSPAGSVSTFATGLNIEDYEEDEDLMGIVHSEPFFAEKKVSKASSQKKRAREIIEEFPSPFVLDESPIRLSGLEELENVPRRRKLLG